MLVKILFPLFLLTHFVVKAELKYLVQISDDLKKSNRPFAASYYLKSYLKKNSSEKFHSNYEHLLGLIDLVGYGVFDELSLFDTRRYPFAAMYYHGLKSLVFTNQYKRVIKTYESFPKAYKDHPVFLQLAGFSAYQLNKNTLSLKYFKQCNQEIKDAKTPHFMSTRNYFLIAQQCQAYLGREYYRLGKYRAALQVYSRIDESSFYYPNTFTEKAWSYYQLHKYNLVLGLNLASHASWLTPFYTGEIDLLASLSLIKLCRWDDVFYFLRQLHSRSNKSIANLNRVEFFLEKNLQNYLNNNKKVNKNLGLDLKRILNRFKLNSYWERVYSEYRLISKELSLNKVQIIDKIDQVRISKFLQKKQKKIYSSIKKYLFDEIRNSRLELYRNKAEADALELEVYSRYRNTLYKNENGLDSLSDKEVSKDDQGDQVDTIVKSKPRLKWIYEEEKWRDEVGKYNVNAPSMCKDNKKELSL